MVERIGALLVLASLFPACQGGTPARLVVEGVPATIAEGRVFAVSARHPGAAAIAVELDARRIEIEGDDITTLLYAPAVPPTGATVSLDVTALNPQGQTLLGGEQTFDLTVTNVGAVRAFAVGNHLHKEAGASPAAFDAEMRRLMEIVRPNLSSTAPNLVVFAEDVGLVNLFAGQRGAEAMTKATATDLIVALFAAYEPAIDHFERSGATTSVDAQWQALTDTMWRPFVATFSGIARDYQVFVVAGTVAPDVNETHDPELVALMKDPAVPGDTAWAPTELHTHTMAAIFGPDGRLLGTTKKVNLVEFEASLQITPGSLDDVKVYDTPAGRLGVAISLDAFVDSYVGHLDLAGAEILVQPDANPSRWCQYETTLGPWAPDAWLVSTLGSIQSRYPSLRYNVCPMMVGNLADVVFDGQSSITRRTSTPPSTHYVGGGPTDLTGAFLAIAPWTFSDPGDADPGLSLAERRDRLAEQALALAPGGAAEDQYRESVVFADLPLTE